ncbi:MAG TPA: hypothetical protein VF426_00375 [Marmoricola sp.]
MSPKKEDRPREVTLGTIAVVILGVLVIARAFDALGGLGSLETQKELRSALDSDSARQLGVTIGDLTDVMHAMILIAAAATAVSIVTALYAITGDRSARWGLFASGIVGGFGTLMFDPVFGVCLGVAAGFATISRSAAAWFEGASPTPPYPPQVRDDGRRSVPPADQRGPTPPPAWRPPEPDRGDGAGEVSGEEHPEPPPTEGFGHYHAPGGQEPGANEGSNDKDDLPKVW